MEQYDHSIDMGEQMPAIVILERVDNQQRLAFQSLPQSLDPVILLKDLVVSTCVRLRRLQSPHGHLADFRPPLVGVIATRPSILV
jgi:hypothetical protein